MGQETQLKRLVLDTNVVVSALLFTGPTNRFVALWQSGTFEMLASGAMVQEYARVLAYPKFGLSVEEITEILHEDLLPFVTAIHPDNIPAVIPEDPSDNEFLACAVAGGADALVSGDLHLLRLGSYQNIPILTVAAALKRL